MTVSSSTNRDDYAGNGSTTSFAVSFRFLENSHIKATLRDALSTETLQAETTDYTLTGAGGAGGGTLVMLVAPPSGTTLTIQRDVPATQETDYVENDEFPAESHEDALDKLTMLVQQQGEDSTRHIGFSDTVSDATGSAVELSQDATQRADKFLGFDTAGNIVTKTASSVGLVDQDQQDKRYGPTFATVAAMVAANPVALDGEIVNPVVGMLIGIVDYATGNNSGLMIGSVVAAATGTADGGSFIDLNNGLQWKQNFPAEVSVELFGAVNDGGVTDSSTAINAAIATKLSIVIDGSYGIGTKIVVDKGDQTPASVVGIRATAGSEFVSFGGNTDCMDLEFISYYGRVILPIMTGFSGYALKLKGTGLANIFVPRIISCGDALVLETINATHATVLDSNVEIQHVELCTTAVRFTADNDLNVMQGNEIKINFIGQTLEGIVFDAPGLSPNWDSNKVVTQAFDPLLAVNARYLKNNSAVAVSRFTTSVDSWIGAMGATAKYVDGAFNGLIASFNIADAVVLDGQFSYTGIDNKIKTSSDVKTTAYKSATVITNSKASFNGGVGLATNISKIQFPITVDFLDGTTRQFYIYNQLTDGFTNHISVFAGELSMQGVIWTFLIDQSGSFTDEITLVALNVSGATISSGTDLFGYVRLGLD